MMMKNQRRILRISLLLLILAMLFIACRPDGDELPVPSETDPAVETEVPAEIVEEPTVTPDVPEVLLVISGDSDLDIAAQVQTALELLTGESGLTLKVENTLTPEMLLSGVRVVVGMGQGIDLSGLASSAPEVQFVAIHQPAAIPTANLSVIGDPIADLQRKAFMAGYLTALVSSDYKIAGLIASDQQYSEDVLDAFTIGVRYYCGWCRPSLPPYVNYPFYPQVESFPAASDLTAYQTLIADWLYLGVNAVYVDMPLVSSELIVYLMDAGMNVVGGASPDLPRDQWVGTVVADPVPGLQRLWPDLMSGMGGSLMPSSITVTDAGSGLFSEGRLRLFNRTLADLDAGLISTEYIP